jgi:hypothetical protein
VTLATVCQSQIIYDPNAVPKLEDQLKFLSYGAQYGKTYSNTTEFNQRLKNFMAVDTFIANYDELDVVLSHNKFSDWSPEERNKILGLKPNATKTNFKGKAARNLLET